MPPNPPRAPAGKSNRRGPAAPQKYRGIEYSVAKKADGLWTWQLHLKTEPGGPIVSGTARGMNPNAAIEGALRAIDKMLDSKK
jgi:hypothetical protein